MKMLVLSTFLVMASNDHDFFIFPHFACYNMGTYRLLPLIKSVLAVGGGFYIWSGNRGAVVSDFLAKIHVSSLY